MSIPPSALGQSAAIRVISAYGDPSPHYDQGIQERLLKSIEAAVECRVSTTYPVALVFAPDLRSPSTSVSLREARGAASFTLLITRRAPDNLVELASMLVDSVIFLDATQDELESAVARIQCGFSIRRALAAAAAPYASQCIVARAVTILSESKPVPATIARAAGLFGIRQKSLVARWNGHSVSQCCTLKEFLSALRLLHYAEMRAAGASFQEAIHLLGISRRTLYLRTRQLFATTPSRILVDGGALSWMRRLTNAAMWDI
jgi:hypothetical protein